MIVGLTGELDLASAPQLERVLNELAERDGERIILDLTDLSFSDAAGLRAIEHGGQRLGSRLIVCGPRPPVQRLIQLTQLDEVVNVDESGPPEGSDAPASNAAYVRQLWEAYQRGGPEQFARLVPDDVTRKSAWSGGETLRGTQELLEFWSQRSRIELTPQALTPVGDDVLVTWRVENAEPREFWSIFCFDGRRLVAAMSFRRETEAIAALRLESKR